MTRSFRHKYVEVEPMGVLPLQEAQTVFFLAIGVELNGAGVYVLKYAIQGGCNGAGVRSCSCAGCSKRP